MDMIDRIIDLINKKKMTAKQLTTMLDVNPSTISEWKKHKTKPSVEHIRRLAEIFDVTTDYIINGVEGSKISYKEIDDNIDYTMLDVFKRLTTEHKAAVRDFFYMCVRELEGSSIKLEDMNSLANTDSTEDAGLLRGNAALAELGISLNDDIDESDDSDFDAADVAAFTDSISNHT